MTNKDPLHSTGNSAQCYAAAGMGGEFGEKWIHAHVWLRVPESITTLLTGYMSIQNKKLKKKKKKRWVCSKAARVQRQLQAFLAVRSWVTFSTFLRLSFLEQDGHSYGVIYVNAILLGVSSVLLVS